MSAVSAVSIANSLFEASSEGDADKVRKIFALKKDVYPRVLFRAFRLACEFGHASVVAAFLEDVEFDPMGPEDNDNWKMPFFEACSNGHAEVVKLLLKDERIDPDATIFGPHNTAFESACHEGRAEVVKILLDDFRVNPCPIDYDTNTAKHYQHVKNVVEGHTKDIGCYEGGIKDYPGVLKLLQALPAYKRLDWRKSYYVRSLGAGASALAGSKRGRNSK